MAGGHLLAVVFEAQRDHLRAVAYRLFGPVSDAGDAVKGTWHAPVAPVAAARRVTANLNVTFAGPQ